jgi:glycosyltransferase involved in cell wall biosynthesis
MKMAHPAISIIIPVYNAEDSLQACLDSATQQTLKDLEIICIDDASTDSSSDILSRYAHTDPRVRVIKHDTNKGEGAARNTGLDKARGEYIFHLDADDTIPQNALKLLYREAQSHGSDMVKGGFVMFYETGRVDNEIYSSPKSRLSNTNIHESKFLQNLPANHCSYLYNRQFLEQHNIRYRTDLVVGLDLVALATALIHASTVTLIPDIVHHYHQSETSVIRGPLSAKIAIDAIRSRVIINNLLNNNGMYEAAIIRLKNWDFIITTYWLRMPSSLTLEECSKVFSEFRSLIFDNNITPWNTNTPYHFRYILALVLAHDDVKALSFLGKKEATVGLSNQEQLKKCLKFILTQAPDDVDTLMKLGLIAVNENNLNEALSVFEEIIRYDDGHIDAQLQIFYALQRMGRYDESRERLDIAQQTLLRNIKSHKNINDIIKAKDVFYKEEHDILIEKINTTQKELEAIRNSFPWKFTAPLRKIKNLIANIRNLIGK